MKIEINGLDNLTEQLEDLPDRITEGLRQGVGKGLLTLQAAQRNIVHVDTSELRTSIKTEVAAQGDTIKGRTYTNAPHAAPNEFGTGQPGKDSPNPNPNVSPTYTSKKSWTYYNDKLGQFVYTRGMPARPFMYPGLKQVQNQIKQDIADSVKDKTKG